MIVTKKSFVARHVDRVYTGGMRKNKLVQDVWSSEWQETRGVYSPAKKVDLGNCWLVFVSGVQPEKDSSHNVVLSDVESQVENVFAQIEKILQASGAAMDDVVKAHIYLTDMADYLKVSKVRDKWFAKCKPTSTILGVNEFTRKGAKVEIEVTAIVSKQI